MMARNEVIVAGGKDQHMLIVRCWGIEIPVINSFGDDNIL